MNAINLPTAINDIRGQLNKMDGEFRMALPPHISVEKFKRVAITAVQGNPDLLAADRRSLFQACTKAAQDGLLPDGREAALVIFRTKVKRNGVEEWVDAVQYMPMVGGILKRVRNSGELSAITSQIVYRNDVFRYWVDGDGEHIQHEPLLFGDRGEIVGVYAIAKTKDGSVYVEPMTRAQVEKVRSVSRSKDKGPWVSWWEEMARKTAIRRLSKRLPTSTDVIDTLLQRDDDVAGIIEPAPQRPQLSDFEHADEPRSLPAPDSEDAATDVITVYDVFGAEIYSGLVQTDAENALRNAAKGLSPEEKQALRDLNPAVYDAVYPHHEPDHVGAELGLPPMPEDSSRHLRTNGLVGPDNVVWPPDQDGLKRWSTAWREQFSRIDVEPADVLRDLTAAASAAAVLFNDKPKTVAWIEGFVAEMRQKVGAK